MVDVMRTRNRMKALTVMVLCFLRLFSRQVIEAGSYSTYYVELTLESLAVPNVTELLQELGLNVSVDSSAVNIFSVNITTACSVTDRTTCTCSTGYIWSNGVCNDHPDCCNSQEATCTMSNSSSTPMCLPKSRVTVIGSLTLNRAYTQGLADSSSQEFEALAKNLSNTLKTSFSELSGFDSLVITQFREGSVIAEFEMTVNANFDTTTLAKKTAALQKDNKDYNFTLETRGIVKMKLPKMPVCYNGPATIKCEFSEQLESDGTWRLNNITEIVNGTEVEIQPQGKILNIKSTSNIWKGTYECIFVKEKIIHKASGNLDIALLPEDVDTTLSPQFPDCTIEPKREIAVKIKYSIANSTEPYRVKSRQVEIKGVPDGDRINYELSTIINCASYSDKPDDRKVSLTFENRLNQTKSIDVVIPVITRDFCEKDGDWPRAKPGYNATLQCTERSKNESKPIQVDALSDALHSASNLLDGSLREAWDPQPGGPDYKLPAKYLQSVEGLAVYTGGPFPAFVNYAFTLVNSFQGFLILLTGCIGEKKVRDALLKYVTVQAKSSKSETSTKFTSSIVKK
ncbi:hypothetical protein MATL_G00156360 [Megalops atlanticus]|uniref:SEA domain-containing protein n=1 Tax=Megalops atlanticus TaxID=7932 RepID=A0A9D3T7N8_MEGAT|nr:hypothetical protein MATL_G00156360 [Megalops atlanticus]